MKAIFLKLEENEIYKAIFRSPYTYVTGAILLSIFQIAHLASLNAAWGVSGPFVTWTAKVYTALGGDLSTWSAFSSKVGQASLNNSILADPASLRNIGVIVGAFMATLFASEFKIKKIKSKKQVIAAVVGGLLMGYGTRLAMGCNIGALYSGIAAFSLSGWVFAIALFFGAFLGTRLLYKYFM